MFDTTEAQEIPLTKRYLQILAATSAGKYAVKVSESAGSGLWTVCVTWPDKDSSQPVLTSRGDTKIWRDVIGAIAFVKANCSTAKSVTVHVGDWQLRWQQPC